MRAAAATALGNFGDKRAVTPLLELVFDDVAEVRAASVEALGQLRDKRAVEYVVEALKDQEVFVQFK